MQNADAGRKRSVLPGIAAIECSNKVRIQAGIV
jgi:hypothetical protein